MIYPTQVDAMLIAETALLPTLNGISTLSPHGWQMYDVMAQDYEANVSAWVRSRGLEKHQGCALDLTDQSWELVH